MKKMSCGVVYQQNLLFEIKIGKTIRPKERKIFFVLFLFDFLAIFRTMEGGMKTKTNGK